MLTIGTWKLYFTIGWRSWLFGLEWGRTADYGSLKGWTVCLGPLHLCGYREWSGPQRIRLTRSVED